MKVKTYYSKYDNCFLIADRYVADNSIAIKVWNNTEGPIVDLTVCLDDRKLGKNESYIDTNNWPEALSFISKYKLGTPTGFYKASGYCIYPSVVFDMKEVEKYTRRLEE